MDPRISAPRGRSASTRWSGYREDEAEYLDWHGRCMVKLTTLLPGVRRDVLVDTANHLYHCADHLPPEDAAEIAAMWWPVQ